MLQLSEQEIMKVFLEKLRRMGKHSTSVVNPADPTEVNSGVATLGFEYGFSKPKEEEWPEEDGPFVDIPLPENIVVAWTSCCWGLEVTVTTSAGIARFFHDYHTVSVPFVIHSEHTEEEVFNLIKRILLEGEEEYKMEEME